MIRFFYFNKKPTEIRRAFSEKPKRLLGERIKNAPVAFPALRITAGFKIFLFILFVSYFLNSLLQNRKPDVCDIGKGGEVKDKLIFSSP